ncbi:MAG: J domain-containing protein, partial [Anaerolineae bacterium]
QKYDHLGAQWQQWQHMGRDPSDFDFSQWFSGNRGQTHVEFGDLNDLFGGGAGGGGFSDFFQSVFGGGGRYSGRPWGQPQPQRRRGRDYEQPVEITLEEAYRGTHRTLEVSGQRLDVKIPPGVRTGSKVRLAGKGGRGTSGGVAGDIYLVIRVSPHQHFQRDGDDLIYRLPVELYTALLGGEVQVPTLEGQVRLKIPPETQAGRSFRLKGQGMPLLKRPKKRGDLYAQVHIVLPQGLTQREKDLYQELASLRRRH